MSSCTGRFLSCLCNVGIFKPKVIPVKVNLYDLSNGMAIKLAPVLVGMPRKQLSGIWHTGTVVFDEEFYYSSDGVLKCAPAHTLLGPPRRMLDMGSTEIRHEAFSAYVDYLANTTYRAQDFHIIQNNANKFTDELVCYLTGDHIPNYIRFLPDEIPKRLLRFMGSITSPNFIGIQISPASSITPTVVDSHMTLLTVNSGMVQSSLDQFSIDPFHGTKIFPVRLYIYDLSQGLVGKLPESLHGTTLTGIWHTGIVVYRLEFFFSSEGIKICQPSGTILGDPHKTVDLGETEVPFEKFMTYLLQLSTTSFRPEDYDMLTYNCNTFSDAMATHLTCKKMPPYIIEQTNDLFNSPLVTQVEDIISETKDSALHNLNGFMKATVAAMNPMTVTNFISRHVASGKLPFVDDK